MLMDELRTGLPAAHLRRVMDLRTREANRLAHEILSVFPPEMIARLEEFPDRLQFRISGREGQQIQRVVLGRQSLERLDEDPARDVKIEYLKRELSNAATTRRTWAYPRTLALR